MPLEEIERICTALACQAQGVTDVNGQSLVKGDPVRITGGPLRGLNAVFESTLSDRERVRLLIHFLSKGAHVKVEREYIEKVRLNEWTRAHLRVS